MNSDKCLYCYQKLSKNEQNYHSKCSKKFFGTATAPLLEYSLNEMEELAKKVVQYQVTVPGVQAKLSFHFEPKRGEQNRLTLVGLWGNYILKPPPAKFKNLPENEDLTMHLAELFKIKTVPHALIKLQSGQLSYITKRIDRVENTKLHMEDLCQLSERLTEDKYKGSMEQVGKTIMQYSSNPVLDAITLFEVTLFSFLTGNADMHLKNFSLINTESGLTQITPSYDLLSTRLVIPEKDDAEELALTLNGRKRKFKQSDFIAFAESLKLNAKQINNVFGKFEKSLPKALEFINLSFLPKEFKDEYKALISDRAKRILSHD